MKQQTSAGIIVYYKRGDDIQYLLLQYASGHWDFAKGKVEAGETLEQAALRELQEETSLTNVTIHEDFKEGLTYFFKEKTVLIKKTVYFFVGRAQSQGPVALSREHKDYIWLPYTDALQQVTYQNARDVLMKAHEFILNLNV